MLRPNVEFFAKKWQEKTGFRVTNQMVLALSDLLKTCDPAGTLDEGYLVEMWVDRVLYAANSDLHMKVGNTNAG